MEIAELVLKYIQALVWPSVTVGLVWGLRGHIRDAFTRMTRVETPAGAIEFAVDARDVLNRAEAVTEVVPEVVPDTVPEAVPDAVPDTVPRPPEPDWRWSYPPPAPAPVPGSGAGYGSRAPRPQRSHPGDQGSPGSPETGWTTGTPGWRQQLQQAREMADAAPAAAVVTAWNALLGTTGPPADVDRAGLPPEALRVFHQLRDLCDQATHSAGAVTPGAAGDFIDSCQYLARLVERLSVR